MLTKAQAKAYLRMGCLMMAQWFLVKEDVTVGEQSV